MFLGLLYLNETKSNCLSVEKYPIARVTPLIGFLRFRLFSNRERSVQVKKTRQTKLKYN